MELLTLNGRLAYIKTLNLTVTLCVGIISLLTIEETKFQGN